MISSPGPDATRSALADWLELTAFLRERTVGSGDLDSLLRLYSDNDRERINGDEPLEEEIAETKREALIARVAEEISFRERTLESDYPFEVIGDPLRIKLRDSQNSTSHPAYLFMLLMTGFKDGWLPSTGTMLVSKIGKGRTLFHHCASFGVAGLLEDGHTCWFGWPRPDKTPFALALESLCSRLGFGRPKNPPPPGLPTRAKDDQIDVVGWRAFRDKRNSTLLIICQAATGDDWSQKSVRSHMGAFTEWFERSPYKVAMSSLAVPFTVHHEVDDFDGEDYDEAVFNALQRLNHQHGVVLDRLRITECIPSIIARGNATTRVGGFVTMDVLKDWIDNLKPEFASAT